MGLSIYTHDQDSTNVSETHKAKSCSFKIGLSPKSYNGAIKQLPEIQGQRIIEIKGKKIFMCHGHKYGVKYGYNSIYYRGKEVGADIVLFGHSHLPIIEEYDGLILMNPGSISHGMGRFDKTLGYIDLIDNKEPILYIKEV